MRIEAAAADYTVDDAAGQIISGSRQVQRVTEYWTFLRFPISSYIPPSAVITSAQLYLFQWKSQNTNPMIVEMREVKSSWSASTLTFVGALTMTYNASAETFIAVSDSTSTGPQGYITFQATESAKRWYSSPSTNYGVVIRCMDGQTPTNRIFVNSSEHNIPARRPILHVSYQILGDTTPPISTASIISGTAGANGWYVSDVTLKLTASDEVGGSGIYAIAYGEGTPTTEVLGSTVEIPISDGQHVIAYRARDIAGNWESIKYAQVNVDTKPPTDIEVLNILYDDGTKWFNQSGTAYYSNAQSNRIVTFELDFMDNVSGPYRIVGNNAFGVTPSDNNGEDGWALAYTIVAGTTPLSPQTITATAYDTAGNSKQITMPITLVQDITGPTGYTIDAPEYPSGAYTVTVTGGTDVGSGVNGTYLDEFPTDSGEPTTLRSTMPGDTTPGTHYYRALQVDRLGNKGQIVSASSTIGVMSASIVSVTEDSGSAYMYYNTTTKKLYYSGLGASSFTINIDVTGSGAPYVSASGSSAFGDTPIDNTPGVSPNVFSLTYTIEEGASFQGTITITLSTSGSMTSTLLLPVELDNVAPSGYMLVAPAYASSAYNVAIVGGSDTGVGLDSFYLDRFSSDSGEPSTARTSMAGDMSEGTHFYRAYAVDLVGNKGTIVSNRTIFDTTAPTISIESVTVTSGIGVVSSASGWTLKYGKQACTFTIAVTASDSASGILSVKGSIAFSDTPEDTTGPDYLLEYSIEANAEGPSTITITATDRIGWSSNATLKLERDITPPTQITGIMATRKGNDVMLSWNEGLDANGISKYVIYRGSSKDSTIMLIQINASQDADPAQVGIQYLDVKAPKGTIYYKVTAIDNLGNEASSLTAEAKKVGALQTGSAEFPYWIIIVLVVVAVIAVVGFMMLGKKKEEEKSSKSYRSYDTVSAGPTYGDLRPQHMQQPMMQPMQSQMPQMAPQMAQPQMGMQYGAMQSASMQSAGTGVSFSHQATLPSATRDREPIYSSGPAQKVTPVTFEKSAICTKCKGIMKKGSQGIKCACGSPYHEECANRLGKCSNCSRVISKGQLNEVRGTLPEGTVKATLDSKCYTCNGAIKQGLTMYKCPCGYTYHEACAIRIINCKNCGRKMTL
ncbi:MAG: DNRLRE domain-containing protein [Thermoplasmata archaeon]